MNEFYIIVLLIFLFGIFIGSFLNVYIIRTKTKESFIVGRSHCMKCGKTIKWYDLFPVFSYLFLRGKCRYCKEKISPQYPLIELLNGLGYAALTITNGVTVTTLLYCLCFSALIMLSAVDIRDYEIPYSLNIFILLLGVAALGFDVENYLLYVIGLISVGGLLFVIQLVSRGAAIGGGDVFLMAAAGFLLGWKLIIVAFVIGCVLGSVIHIVLMKKKGQGNMLPFGPYLAGGIFISMLFGNEIVKWYTGLLIF